MKFGLMFFASTEDALADEKYGLVIDSAKFGDEHGFSSIWTPERHFTQFGSLYPNPAVLNAALSQVTERIRLQAGSVVMPLHHPLALAEAWAMVDNLSNGRVGISLASGWNPDDFAWCPEVYEQRHQLLFENIITLNQLWQGESIAVTNGKGQPTTVRIYPTPIQPQLPIWITAASNPQTFANAGKIGANLLTHLLDQGIEPLAEKIALYRQARAKHGHDPEAGIVSLMLHTFVGEEFATVCEQARKPYCDYLKSNIGLLRGLAQSRGQDIDFATLSERDLDTFVNFLYERFATSRGLIGTPESCLELVRDLDQIGVDEIACLLDFGPSKQAVIEHLPYLNELKERYRQVDVQRVSVADSGAYDNLVRSSASQGATSVGNSSIAKASLEEVRARCQARQSGADFYQLLAKHGLQLGETYRGIQQFWLGHQEVLAEIKTPAGIVANTNALEVYAPVLDACHQVLGATLFTPLGGSSPPDGNDGLDNGFSEPDSLYLPTRIDSFEVHGPLGREGWSHAVLKQLGGENQDTIQGDVRIFNAAGEVTVEVLGLQMQRTSPMADSDQTPPLGHDWLYELVWQLAPLDDIGATDDRVKEEATGRWIIFCDRKNLGTTLATQLQNQGHVCELVYCQGAETSEIIDTPADIGLERSSIHSLDPTDPRAMDNLLKQLLSADKPPCKGIIHLWSLDVTPSQKTTLASLQADQALTVTSLLHLVQSVTTVTPNANLATTSPPKLWIITEDVQTVGGETAAEITPRSIAQAPMWGLGRVAATEFPQFWGGLIDLDSTAPLSGSVQQLQHQLLRPSSPSADAQIVFRNGQRYIVRLVRSAKTQVPPEAITFSTNATYLITGGLGHFGLGSAQWLASKGVKSLALTGRRAPSGRALQVIETLQQNGVNVQVLQADVADAAAMAEAIETVQAIAPPIKGIFHIAGATQQKTIPEITETDLTAMLRPKVWGTWNLHQLTLDLDLNFFFCTSSMSPIFGSQGLGHYAAANYFLDIFATYRQQLDLPGLTVNVGALAGGGMALASPEGEKYTTQIGLHLTTPENLLDVAGGFILPDRQNSSTSGPVTNLIVAEMDWSIFKPLYESTTGKRLLTEIGHGDNQINLGQQDELWQELEKIPQMDERQEQVVLYLQRTVAQALGHREGASLIDPHRGFFDMGMDSLMAVALKNKLEASLAIALPTVLIFEHPNILSLAKYIMVDVLEWGAANNPDLSHADFDVSSVDVESPSEIPELSDQLRTLSEESLDDLISKKLAKALEGD